MNLLVITYTFSKKSTAGQIFTGIVNSLVLDNNIMVYYEGACGEGLSDSVHKQFTKGKFKLPERLHKLIMLFFGFASENFYWFYLIQRRIKKELNINNRYDYIIAFANGDKPEVIKIAYNISKKFNIPLYIHLVDPIPPPKHWGLLPIYWQRLKNYVLPAFKHSSLISFGNSRMLDFQNSLYEYKLKDKAFVLPDAVEGDFIIHGCPNNYTDKLLFTFLGGFYGKRTPISLFKGFAEFIKQGYDAYINIYGNNNINLNDFILSDNVKSRINILPFTNNVNEVIKISTLLIDVDVPYEDNVFSSSKLKRYLFNDRIILAITSPNSPTYDLCSMMTKSCILASHNYKSISDSMVYALNIKYNINVFDDRKKIIDNFKSINIAKKIVTELNKIE